jgi:hypothetical protein
MAIKVKVRSTEVYVYSVTYRVDYKIEGNYYSSSSKSIMCAATDKEALTVAIASEVRNNLQLMSKAGHDVVLLLGKKLMNKKILELNGDDVRLVRKTAIERVGVCSVVDKVSRYNRIGRSESIGGITLKDVISDEEDYETMWYLLSVDLDLSV